MVRKNYLIAAIALTVGSGTLAVIGLTADPVLTPFRVICVVLLATGLGLAWGRVIWERRHH